MSGHHLLIAIVVVGVLIWLVPAVFVAAYAAGHAFNEWGVFLCALFIPWPVVLFGLVLFVPLVEATRVRLSVAEDGRTTIQRPGERR